MTPALLLQAARQFGTPLYAYDFEAVAQRFDVLDALFAPQLRVSYAIKANPNLALLKAIRPRVETFDASSIGEVERALAAGMPASGITFSGPAKRRFELRRAIEACIGELVLESLDEALVASQEARSQQRVQPVLMRINPLKVPRRFGASMAGTASQFGFDEEDLGPAIEAVQALPGLELIGFHIYSGSNCLDADAIGENFGIFIELFRRAQRLSGITPRRLVFGSGFGIPYLPEEAALDHEAVAGKVVPMVQALLDEPAFRGTRCTLEMGRWLVGLAGWLLASVVSTKTSRGSRIRTLDAGFNNHLAACGMMGSVIRRNWRIQNLSNPAGTRAKHVLVGPLCTTIDKLATDIELPAVRAGDVLAVAGSGAYGLTASPVRFIGHPEPAEAAFDGQVWHDVSEAWPVQRCGPAADETTKAA